MFKQLMSPFLIAMPVIFAVSVNGADIPPAATAPTPAPRPAVSADQSDELAFQDSSTSANIRLVGGSRGAGAAAGVFLLVSAKPGRTIHARPVIYWYLTADTEADIDLVISRPGDVMPMFRKRHSGSIARGLHAFSLADAPKDLETGVLYQVTVTIWEDPDDSSVNPVSAGFIQRVAAPAALADSGKDYTPANYAAASLWYDALDALTRGIERESVNMHLRKQRLSLLRQQHVFLTFAPEKQYAAIPAVAEAEKSAKQREEQLLGDLAATEKAEAQKPLGSRE